MFVIADDITGAAEIAGIAHTLGVDATVIATDTRSMTEAEAVAAVEDIAMRYDFANEHCVVFKKVDSALRGHVVAEINALLKHSHYRKVLYLPCNPSKGRVIRNGIYYVDDMPISDTAFHFDPEFPALSSSLKERFPCLDIHDAVSTDDIRRIVAAADDDTLLVGAADLFEAFCHAHASENSIEPDEACKAAGASRYIIVQGSTQSKDLSGTEFFQKNDFLLCPMPDDVFAGSERTDWISPTGNLCLTIPQKSQGSPQWLKQAMARAVAEVIDTSEQGWEGTLIIEGGATACAILTALGWKDFEVEKVIAPGVVMLQRDDSHIILKPGSYPWGKLFG